MQVLMTVSKDSQDGNTVYHDRMLRIDLKMVH